jgi:hypothetical protein
MTDQQTIAFTNEIFDLIKKSRSIEELETIADKLQIPEKNRMSTSSYPKIEFDIKPADIEALIDKNLIHEDLSFETDITEKLTDPLTKLLYATAWKNGDLKKIKHIIKGILEAEKEHSVQDDALVFYQFGKYLTKTPGQPIIDQHVIRAFAIYSEVNTENIEKLRKLGTINKKHKPLIAKYKEWLTSDNLTYELKRQTDYSYHIDKLLFAAGKTIKLLKPRKNKSIRIKTS